MKQWAFRIRCARNCSTSCTIMSATQRHGARRTHGTSPSTVSIPINKMIDYVIVYKPFSGQFENMIVPSWSATKAHTPYDTLLKVCITTVMFVVKYLVF